MTMHCPTHHALKEWYQDIDHLKQQVKKASYETIYQSVNTHELTELLVCYTETKERAAETLKIIPFRHWYASDQKSFTENIIKNAPAHLLNAFIDWIKEVDHGHPAPVIITIAKNKNEEEAQTLIQEVLKDNSINGYDILLFLRELDHTQIQFLMDLGINFQVKFDYDHLFTGMNDDRLLINDIRPENLSLVEGKLDFRARA